MGVILSATIIVFIGIFWFPNGSSNDDFSNITKIEYQKYNHSKEDYSKITVIEDNDTISQLADTFNKANHRSIQYKKVYRENYKLTLFYEDDTTEILRIWKSFGKDYDLLESDIREGIYEIKNNKSREALRKILK